MYAIYIWLALILLALIVEASTAQMVSIWFVTGGIAALITYFCGGNFGLQILLFFVVTMVALLATRPLVKKILQFKKEDTNAGRYIGKEAVVIADIDNLQNMGQIKVLGTIWTARSANDQKIPEGTLVTIQAIEGVKAIVVPV